MKELGINIKLESLDGKQAVKRANQISDKISKDSKSCSNKTLTFLSTPT